MATDKLIENHRLRREENIIVNWQPSAEVNRGYSWCRE